MKIIVAGNGKVGSALTRQLSAEGYEITVIDTDKEVVGICAERYDVLGVLGNCASIPTLRDAGADSAELLIAATGADELNLLCCTTAHGLNPRLHTIARIRNPEYLEQAFSMRDIFALSLAVNPEQQTALEIERLLRYPGFLKRDSFAKGRVEIVELAVDARSKLCDLPLSRLDSIVKCKVLVCAVLRSGVTAAPDGSFVLREGDRVFVTAPTDNLAVLLRNLGIVTHKARRVLLCGGGRVAYYLAKRLTESGISVQIIEKEAERCVELAGLLPQASVIHGDASDQALLESEGLAGCDALVSLTGLDELNMVISLYGNSLGVPQIITKLGRVKNSGILDVLPLGSVVCPKELCCNTIVRYVRAMHNQVGAAVSVHSIANGQAEALEFIADETTRHCGESLKSITLKPNVLVASITHGAQTEIPDGSSSFSRGDTVILVTSGETVVRQLNDIFA